MPNKSYEPATVHKPSGAYSHAIEVEAGARMLFLAGQGGRGPDGVRPADIRGQTRNTWQNILNILADAGMGADDIVRVTTYVTDPSFLGPVSEERAKAIGGARPAGTFLVVAGLAVPDMLIEIDVVAAKAR